VLFDLDGTLVHSERESAEAMARALATAGVVINQGDRDFMIGRSWVEIDRHLRLRHPDYRWSRAELIERTAAEREAIIEADGLTILPGARETVQRFADRGVPLAVVTGSSRREAAAALDFLGLADRFSAVLAAEDVETSKPDPAGYLGAAAACGAAPERCLVIEDSAAGIAAGRAAGARVVAVRVGNFADQDQSQAHRIIESLLDLSDGLVAELWGMVPAR
jgi:HAD superfamily hydrolase (TIGR01509 family)